MASDNYNHLFSALDEWFSSVQGENVAAAFANELKAFASFLQGDIALQLGGCTSNNKLLPQLKFNHYWLAAPNKSPTAAFNTSFNRLPLDRNSVDCIIAPLTLHAYKNTHHLLDEIDWVLKSCGYVIFFGINTLSLWGAWLRLADKTCFGHEKGKFKSAMTIKRGMIQRGYIQCHLTNFYYVPPFNSKLLIERFKILNVVGKMVSPLPAGFYCLIMQKYQELPLVYSASQIKAPLIEKIVPTI